MSTVDQVEDAVRQFSADQLSAFRAWFAEFGADEWDRQFEADVAASRLDWPVDEAKRDLLEGRCTDRWIIEPNLVSGLATSACRKQSRIWRIVATKCYCVIPGILR